LRIRRKAASLFDYRIDDFELDGYDPHPHIAADVAV
jgi:thymidylate synthase